MSDHNSDGTMEQEATAQSAPEIPETAGNGDAPEPTLEERLAAAEAKAAENLEGWQRAVAELANARKRFNTQTQAAHRDARAGVVDKLLPFLDDLDRALENAPPAVAGDAWFEGLQMVRRKFGTILSNLQVEPIAALGEPFDPTVHEALSTEEVEGVASGVVTRELQTGYMIGDRVIRPSLVYVAA